ncbi:unnamed protein product [Arabis nemorensis]|uniref:Uncharacterized protein n=1 Tax=Arabis nemorensis TaxID=586526 RepID=A0A565AYP8_9BRAS|nr:unnamed protein product [Arabis nemorensis]
MKIDLHVKTKTPKIRTILAVLRVEPPRVAVREYRVADRATRVTGCRIAERDARVTGRDHRVAGNIVVMVNKDRPWLGLLNDFAMCPSCVGEASNQGSPRAVEKS